MEIKYNIRKPGYGGVINKLYCPWCGETRSVWDRWNEIKENPSIPIRGIADVTTKERNIIWRSLIPQKSIVKSCRCYTCEAEWKWYPLSDEYSLYITKRGIIPQNPMAACPWCGEAWTIWEYLKSDEPDPPKGISGGLLEKRWVGPWYDRKFVHLTIYNCHTCGAEWDYE